MDVLKGLFIRFVFIGAYWVRFVCVFGCIIALAELPWRGDFAGLNGAGNSMPYACAAMILPCPPVIYLFPTFLSS